MNFNHMYHYLVAILVILISIPIILSPVAATQGDTGITNTLGSIPFLGGFTSSSDQVIIHFFFNPGCGACEKIHPVMEAYASNHSDVRVEFYSLAGNQTNIDLFNAYQKAYNITHAHVPILFLGTTTLMGEEEITDKLDTTVAEIKKGDNKRGLLQNNTTSSGNAVESSINPVFLVVAGIGEGLNPCGLLVLALLLVSLMASQSRRTVLAIGLAYIVAFFAVRLLSGFAIFSVIQLPGLSQTFTLIAAAVAIIAGIIQVKDGLSKKQHPLLSIPDSKKSLISSYMKRASVPAGLVVGALVGIYGMACTAGIYISILGMLYKEPAIGLIYLILYNVLVIIPLLIILLLVFFGIPPEKVSSWRDDQKSMLRLMIGVVMIIMGIVILIPLL
jgi:cytochrome c biogenesis protein CcdA